MRTIKIQNLRPQRHEVQMDDGTFSQVNYITQYAYPSGTIFVDVAFMNGKVWNGVYGDDFAYVR